MSPHHSLSNTSCPQGSRLTSEGELCGQPPLFPGDTDRLRGAGLSSGDLSPLPKGETNKYPISTPSRTPAGLSPMEGTHWGASQVGHSHRGSPAEAYMGVPRMRGCQNRRACTPVSPPSVFYSAMSQQMSRRFPKRQKAPVTYPAELERLSGLRMEGLAFHGCGETADPTSGGFLRREPLGCPPPRAQEDTQWNPDE